MNNNATNHTQYFGFPLFESGDKPSWLTDWNGTVEELDRILEANRLQIQANTQGMESFNQQVNLIREAISGINARIEGDETTIEEILANVESLRDLLVQTDTTVKSLIPRMTNLENTESAHYDELSTAINQIDGLVTVLVAFVAWTPWDQTVTYKAGTYVSDNEGGYHGIYKCGVQMSEPRQTPPHIDNSWHRVTIKELIDDVSGNLSNSILDLAVAFCYEWIEDNNYEVGDWVYYRKSFSNQNLNMSYLYGIYECKVAHTSSNSIYPTNTTYWKHVMLENKFKGIATQFTNVANLINAKADQSAVSQIVLDLNTLTDRVDGHDTDISGLQDEDVSLNARVDNLLDIRFVNDEKLRDLIAQIGQHTISGFYPALDFTPSDPAILSGGVSKSVLYYDSNSPFVEVDFPEFAPRQTPYAYELFEITISYGSGASGDPVFVNNSYGIGFIRRHFTRNSVSPEIEIEGVSNSEGFTQIIPFRCRVINDSNPQVLNLEVTKGGIIPTWPCLALSTADVPKAEGSSNTYNTVIENPMDYLDCDTSLFIPHINRGNPGSSMSPSGVQIKWLVSKTDSSYVEVANYEIPD